MDRDNLNLKFYLLFLSIFILGGCVKQNALPAIYQGKWTAQGDLSHKDKSQPWTKTYNLQSDKYSMEGYPPIEEKGRIDVLQKDSAKIEVKFMPDGEEEDSSYTWWLRLAEDGEKLHIGNQVYNRVK